MHELSVTRNVIAMVAERAAGRRVTRVRLEIGQLSAILPDAVRFCFDLCAQGTVVAGAMLEIVETPGRGHCVYCQSDVRVAMLTGRCPDCGANGLTLLAGEEMLIREMEVEPDASMRRSASPV